MDRIVRRIAEGPQAGIVRPITISGNGPVEESGWPSQLPMELGGAMVLSRVRMRSFRGLVDWPSHEVLVSAPRSFPCRARHSGRHEVACRVFRAEVRLLRVKAVRPVGRKSWNTEVLGLHMSAESWSFLFWVGIWSPKARVGLWQSVLACPSVNFGTHLVN